MVHFRRLHITAAWMPPTGVGPDYCLTWTMTGSGIFLLPMGSITILPILDFVDFFANEIIQKMALTGRKESIDSIINKMPIRPQPNYAYKNNKDLTFSNANKEWGFELPSMSNGAAYGDLDNDGDLDLVINNVNMEAFVYENHTDSMTENHYIKLKFEGPESNKFAIGTSVNLYYDNNVVLSGTNSIPRIPILYGLRDDHRIGW